LVTRKVAVRSPVSSHGHNNSPLHLVSAETCCEHVVLRQAWRRNRA
jgi:hypothetical protein